MRPLCCLFFRYKACVCKSQCAHFLACFCYKAFVCKDQCDHFVAAQVALELSEAQVRDLLLLRRLYHTRMAILSSERKQILTSMSEASNSLESPVDMTRLTADLEANALEEHQTHFKLVRGYYKGVRLLP